MKQEFDKNAVKIRTYISFLDGGSGNETEVESRDPAKLGFERMHSSFQFYDRKTVMVDGEILRGDPFNYSPQYTVAQRLMSLTEAQQENNMEAIVTLEGLAHGSYLAVKNDGTMLRSASGLVYVDQHGSPLPLPRQEPAVTAKLQR